MARYPKEFSKEACDRVEITRLSAIQKLEQVLAGDHPWDRERRALLDRSALLACVQTVTLVFAAEAHELARQGIWTVVDVSREVEKFERNFASELGKYDRPGRILPSLVIFSESDRCDVLRPEVELELHITNEWHQHRAELAALSNRPAAKSAHTVNEFATGVSPDRVASSVEASPEQPPQPATAAAPKSRGGRPEGRPVDGQKLRQLREAKKLSQAGFADTCDPQLSEDTIQRAENGETVDPKTIATIVKGLIDLGYPASTAEAIKKPQ
jgi:hypothetical protein